MQPPIAIARLLSGQSDECLPQRAEDRVDPSRFAELATSSSDDKGSGANGGDLPWFAEADVDPAFGAAIFADGLAEGQILAPVRSSFGWHVIRLDDTRDAKIPSYEEVKPQLLEMFGPWLASAYRASFGQELGDEAFAGYRKHQGELYAARYARLPSALRRAASHSKTWRARRFS